MKSKFSFITKHIEGVPYDVFQLIRKEITVWFCEKCSSRQPIAINEAIKKSWNIPYHVNWFVKCKTCESLITPKIEHWYSKIKKKRYCSECCEPKELQWNKIWLKLPDKKYFDPKEIKDDLDGFIAICKGCGSGYSSSFNFDSDYGCPKCNWSTLDSSNEEGYIVDGKGYPIYSETRYCYDSYSWDETHKCPFCKIEFSFSNGN